MIVESLRKVGAQEWADYYKTKKNIYKSNGRDVKLDIKNPHTCIVGKGHKGDLTFGNCDECGDFAVEFMVVTENDNISLGHISKVPSQEIIDCFTHKGEDIKDNTKSRNKIFKKLISGYVEHMEYKHPELITT